MGTIKEQIDSMVVKIRSLGLAAVKGLQEPARGCYTRDEELQLRAAGKDPDMMARVRGAADFTDYKQRKAAAGGMNLASVDIHGKPIGNRMPRWDAHLSRDENLSPVQRAIRDGRISHERVIEAKREGARGWKKLWAEFDGPKEAA